MLQLISTSNVDNVFLNKNIYEYSKYIELDDSNNFSRKKYSIFNRFDKWQKIYMNLF